MRGQAVGINFTGATPNPNFSLNTSMPHFDYLNQCTAFIGPYKGFRCGTYGFNRSAECMCGSWCGCCATFLLLVVVGCCINSYKCLRIYPGSRCSDVALVANCNISKIPAK